MAMRIERIFLIALMALLSSCALFPGRRECEPDKIEGVMLMTNPPQIVEWVSWRDTDCFRSETLVNGSGNVKEAR